MPLFPNQNQLQNVNRSRDILNTVEMNCIDIEIFPSDGGATRFITTSADLDFCSNCNGRKGEGG